MAQQPGTQAQKPTGRENLVDAVDAFNKLLSPEQRQALSQPQTPGDIVELTKALQDAKVSEKKLQRCEGFLQSVQQFSGIIDTMIQHRPCVSALVWGSVKILLLTAQNYVQYFSCLTKLFKRLGILCPIFKEFQELWPQHQGLQDAVFEYYAQMVRFCTDALAFLRRSSTSMILRALLLPLKDELQEVEKNLIFQQKIVEYQVILAREDEVRKTRQRQMVFNTKWEEHADAELQEWAHNTQWRQRLEASARRNEEHQLKQWKKSRDLELRQEAQKNYSCTGEWLYEMDKYKEWVESCSSALLWCHGIPGSGKSVLSAAVVKHLLDTRIQQTNCGSGKTFLGYFFCNFSEHRSLEFEEIIRSLIKQVLCVFHGSTEFEGYLAKFVDKYNTPTTALWQDLFLRTCRLPNTIFLIFDGIDECHDDIQAQILELLNKLLSIPRCIKVYLSSRTEVYLTRNLPCTFSVSLDDVKQRPEVEGYIDTSLRQRLQDGRLRIQDPGMVEEIKQALMGGVEGMFLWVTLQIYDISRQLNDEEIRETLRSLPRNLDETYIRMLQRIVKERKKDIAVEVFRWLTIARRQLSLRELVEAVVIKDDDTTRTQGLNRVPADLDKVIEACGNFLVIEEPVCGSSKVRFIHSTVVTFLHTHELPENLEVFRIEPRTTEVHLAKRCLQYLHFKDLQTQLERATPVSESKPRRSILSMPVSTWIPPELRSGLVSTSSRKLLKHPSGEHVPRGANLQLFSPISAKPPTDSDAASQMQKSTLFYYVIENWLSHCKNLPPASISSADPEQYWTWFRDLVLNGLNLVKLP
ncbi:hypothetical protein BDZ91DRAFT_760293 [Kalaharituber pfeilii]|nr:hypothetical protein BDZ91DRAFT_760293 [Kalaharituber pfeilii]